MGTTKQPKFKKGEWCFCEFQLQQVKETNEDRITMVSDGVCSMSSHDLSDRCYPMKMEIKIASDAVAYWSKKFHESKCNALNYPDLNRELISRWVNICDAIKDEKKLKQLYERLSDFGSEVLEMVSNLKREEVNGVRIFSR